LKLSTKGLMIIPSQNPDIIVIDLGLPDIDGLDVIKAVRPITKAAIIVVSARGYEREKVEALDCGADDYLTKPFSVVELLARIRVALRHSTQSILKTNASSNEFIIGELKIDLEKRRVFVSGDEIHLTPIEYKLLALLAQYSGEY
jgi:two-component system KDP operon response regulator KdpE